MASTMERRQHPRVQIPVSVEIHHPSFGSRRCVVRDVSKGGVFVSGEKFELRKGAKVKLTVVNASLVDPQATPTIELVVRRAEPKGLGLEFLNNTGKHLWNSVDRLRTELEIGRDFFQAHLSLGLRNPEGRLLIVNQDGRWQLPGSYLGTRTHWRATAADLLESMELQPASELQPAGFQTHLDDLVPENATIYLAVHASVEATSKTPSGPYRSCKWIDDGYALGELCFVSDVARSMVQSALQVATRELDPCEEIA